MRSLLTRSTFIRLCPTPLDEGRLQGYLSALSPEARRAFWGAVLILDGAASLSQVCDRSLMLEGKAPPPLAKVEERAAVLRPNVCLYCGDPLLDECPTCGTMHPPRPSPSGGSGHLRRYCSPAHKAAAGVEAKRARRNARSPG